MLSLAHFRLQRRSLRSLIYLSWIYSFVSRAVGAFSQIYIYELFNSVQLAIIAGIAAFTGIMIGFCICGVVAAYYRLNAKHGFLLSFLFTGLGLILLPFANDVPEACGAAAIRGIGSGPPRSGGTTSCISSRTGNQAAQIYLMGGAASHILQQTVIPLAAVTVLGGAVNVGGFNTVFAIAGALALLAVGARRRPENRLKIFGMSSVVLVALHLMLGFSMTLATLIVYTIGASIMQPIMRVSQHVIDLKTMDSMGHRASDFYPAMILRDVALWVWRTLAALFLLVFAGDARTGQEVISLGMYFIAGAIVITYLGAWILLTWER